MFISLGKMLGKSKIRLGVGYGFYAFIRWIVRKIKGNR